MSRLRIDANVYAQLRTHGEETYPQECCGALLGVQAGEDWVVRSAVRAGNQRTDSAHNRYQISPGELVKIERAARTQGLSIAGFYHSHPDHPAQWSETDLQEAHWIGCSYVITAVAAGKAALTNAFRLTGESEESKLFIQESIAIEE